MLPPIIVRKGSNISTDEESQKISKINLREIIEIQKSAKAYADLIEKKLKMSPKISNSQNIEPTSQNNKNIFVQDEASFDQNYIKSDDNFVGGNTEFQIKSPQNTKPKPEILKKENSVGGLHIGKPINKNKSNFAKYQAMCNKIDELLSYNNSANQENLISILDKPKMKSVKEEIKRIKETRPAYIKKYPKVGRFHITINTK